MLLLPRSHGPATYLAVASSAPHDLQREAEETGNLHDAADPEATTAVVVAAAVARSSGMDGVGSGSGIGSPPQGHLACHPQCGRGYRNPGLLALLRHARPGAERTSRLGCGRNASGGRGCACRERRARSQAIGVALRAPGDGTGIGRHASRGRRVHSRTTAKAPKGRCGEGGGRACSEKHGAEQGNGGTQAESRGYDCRSRGPARHRSCRGQAASRRSRGA